MPDRDARLREAEQILRARLNLQGTTHGLLDRAHRRPLVADGLAATSTRVRLVLRLARARRAGREDLPRLAARRARAPAARPLGHDRGQRLGRAGGARSSRAPSRTTPVDRARPPRRSAARPRTPTGRRRRRAATLAFPWPAAAAATSRSRTQGSGQPWATVQARAAIPLHARRCRAATASPGRVTPVEQRARPGRWSRGDMLRVRLEIEAQSDMTWVVVNDPIPAGASHLGTGLARDSQHRRRRRAEAGARRLWPAFDERAFEAFRAYYEFVPKGRFTVEYTVRLNQSRPLRAAARRASRRCTRRRCSASCRTRRWRSRRDAAARCAPRGVALALLARAASVSGDPRGDAPAARVPPSPTVRAGLSRRRTCQLLDRHGEVLHELRIDRDGARRLDWTRARRASRRRSQRAVIAVRGPALLRARRRRLARARRRGGSAAPRAADAPRGASTITMQLAALLDPELRRGGGPGARSRQKWRQMRRRAGASSARWTQGRDPRGLPQPASSFRGELQGIGGRRRACCSARRRTASTRRRGAGARGAAAARRTPSAEAVARRAWALASTPAATARRATPRRGGGAGARRDRRHRPARRARPARGAPAARAAPGATRRAVRTTLDAALQRIGARRAARATCSRCASRARARRRGAGGRQRDRRGAGLRRRQRRRSRSAAHVDGVRARAPGGLDAEAVPLRARARARACSRRPRCSRTRRSSSPSAGGLYRPQNYDEHFRGLVTVRTALAASLNVPAVRTLRLVGAETVRRAAAARSASTACAESRRLLRSVAGARLGRREPAGSWSTPTARSPTAARGRPLRLARRTTARGRRAPGLLRARGLPRRRHPRRPREPQRSPSASRTRSRRASGPRSRPAPARTCATTGASATRAATRSACGSATSRGEPMHDVSGVTGAAPGVARGDGRGCTRAVPSAPPAAPAGVVAAPRDVRRRRRAARGASGSSPAPSRRRRRPPAPAAIRGSSRRSTGTIIALDPDIPREPGAPRLRGDGRARVAAVGARRRRSGPRARAPCLAPRSAAGTAWRWSTATGAWSTA